MTTTTGPDWLIKLLEHHNAVPIAGMIVGVVAIVAAATVAVLLPKLLLSHRQRMAMIARGMHPDGFLESDEPAGPVESRDGIPPRVGG